MTFPKIPRLVVELAAAAAVGAIVFVAGRRSVDVPAFRPDTVLVTDTLELYRDRPDSTPSLGHRLRFETVKPSMLALTTGRQEALAVRLYCAPMAAETPRPADSSGAAAAVVPPPAVRTPPFSASWDGRRLRTWTVLSDGRARADERLLRAPWELYTADSSVYARQERRLFSLGRAGVGCLKAGGAGAIVGGILGAVAGPDVGWQRGAAIGAAAGCLGRLP